MEIDRTVPPPPPGRRANKKYPFGQMRPGDSLFFPDYGEGMAALNAARGFARRHGWSVVSRREAAGLRLWRV